MDAAQAAAETEPLASASQFRNGLMLSLLAARPLRRRNFTSLRIGRSIMRTGEGYWISLPGEETKTGNPIDLPAPDALTPYIDRYLSHHRPLLLKRIGSWSRGDHDTREAFWISDHRSAMSQAAVYYQVNVMTRRAFGRQLSPHLFRDCAATSIAIEDPEHVYITTSIPGHTTLLTSEQHYNHAQSTEAAGRIQDLIMDLRQGGRDATIERREAA
jgi:integrase